MGLAGVLLGVDLNRAYRHRLYLTPEQDALLRRWERKLVWLWNLANEQRVMAGKRPKGERPVVTYNGASLRDKGCQLAEQGPEMTLLLEEDEQISLDCGYLPLMAITSSCRQETLRDLDAAWQRFFKMPSQFGKPKFKKNTMSMRLKFPAANHWKITLDKNPGGEPVGEGEAGKYLHLTNGPAAKGIGPIRIKQDRPLPVQFKGCALVREGTEWYTCISVVLTVPDPQPSLKPAVGIDRGVVNVLADSTGHLEANPRYADKTEDRVRFLQRRLAKKIEAARKPLAEAARAEGKTEDQIKRLRVPLSSNAKKLSDQIAKLKRHQTREREWYIHQQSNHYVDNFGVIGLEKLQIQNMTASAAGDEDNPGSNVKQKAGLNRAILGACWGKFAETLKYKAEPKGVRIVEVPAHHTSQTCPACGHIDAKNRPDQSTFRCMVCAYEEHADVVGAKNVLARALEVPPEEPRQRKFKLRITGRKRREADLDPAAGKSPGEAAPGGSRTSEPMKGESLQCAE